MRIPIALATLALATAFQTGAANALSSAAPGTPAAPPAISVSEGGGTASCTFSNAGYSGKCTETAPIPAGGTAKAACAGILSCLNNTQCTRTFCSSTTIRSGWALESAVPQKN